MEATNGGGLQVNLDRTSHFTGYRLIESSMLPFVVEDGLVYIQQ